MTTYRLPKYMMVQTPEGKKHIIQTLKIGNFYRAWLAEHPTYQKESEALSLEVLTRQIQDGRCKEEL